MQPLLELGRGQPRQRLIRMDHIDHFVRQDLGEALHQSANRKFEDLLLLLFSEERQIDEVIYYFGALHDLRVRQAAATSCLARRCGTLVAPVQGHLEAGAGPPLAQLAVVTVAAAATPTPRSRAALARAARICTLFSGDSEQPVQNACVVYGGSAQLSWCGAAWTKCVRRVRAFRYIFAPAAVCRSGALHSRRIAAAIVRGSNCGILVAVVSRRRLDAGMQAIGLDLLTLRVSADRFAVLPLWRQHPACSRAA